MTTGGAKPSILVTGGAGYIGSHAALALLDAGWPVVVLDDLSSGHRWAVPEGATFVQGDIADPALVSATLKEHGIQAILHFAGSILVAESMTEPLLYYRNNTAATRTLLETAMSAGVNRFLFSSTAATYGVPDSVPIREDAPTRPINPYGRSKLMSEDMLADAGMANGLDYVVLRYFNVAGADPAGRSGQTGKVSTHLIKIAAEAATGKRDGVAVYGTDYQTPDGSCVRDYIHVSDLADAHVAALEHLLANAGTRITMNCGYGRGFSVLEVLDAVDEVVGSPLPRRIEGRRPGDPDALVADTSLMAARTGWRPQHDHLPTIIRDAIAWERRLTERG
jgi:UDP-glucose 4-epimerase